VAKVEFATDRRNGADCERRFQVSNQTITGAGERRTRLPQYAADVTGGVTMLPLSRRFKAAGNVQSGQLLRA
jgi:predicted peptidase